MVADEVDAGRMLRPAQQAQFFYENLSIFGQSVRGCARVTVLPSPTRAKQRLEWGTHYFCKG
jgi:hypothetical protein